MKTFEQINLVKALLNMGLFYTQIQEITGIDKSKICRIARQDLGMKSRNTEKISQENSYTFQFMRLKGKTIVCGFV
jgi:cell division protein FtsL